MAGIDLYRFLQRRARAQWNGARAQWNGARARNRKSRVVGVTFGQHTSYV